MLLATKVQIYKTKIGNGHFTYWKVIELLSSLKLEHASLSHVTGQVAAC